MSKELGQIPQRETMVTEVKIKMRRNGRFQRKRYYIFNPYEQKEDDKKSLDIANEILSFIGVLEEEEAKQFAKLYLKALHGKRVDVKDKEVYQCIAEIDPRFHHFRS